MPALKTVMRLNALSCLGFGLLFVVMPAVVADFLGDGPHWLILTMGIVLIVNGIHLLLVSMNTSPARPLVLYFSAGDAAWVVLTLVLIATGFVVSTPAGVVTALVVAVMVGGFGLMQYLAVRQA